MSEHTFHDDSESYDLAQENVSDAMKDMRAYCESVVGSPERTYTADEVAELKAQCAAMLEKAAERIGERIKSHGIFDAKCSGENCGACELGRAQGIVRALIPTDPAAALEEVKRQEREDGIKEFLELAYKIEKGWNIGRFLCEVEDAWKEKNK